MPRENALKDHVSVSFVWYCTGVLSNKSIEIQRMQIFTVMFFGFSGERLKSTSICIALLFAFVINFLTHVEYNLENDIGSCHLLLFVNSTNYFQIVRTWFFFSHLFEYSIYLLTKGPGAEFLSQTKSIFFPLLFLSISNNCTSGEPRILLSVFASFFHRRQRSVAQIVH